MLLKSTFSALAVCAVGPSLATLSTLAHAQTPVKLMVGFPAGGSTDVIARLLAEKLKDQLGAPVVVENKAGAGGQLAAQALKTAAPDGNTLFLSHDHTISILPQVVKSPGYDTAKDFVPVVGFATFPNVWALSPNTPAKSHAEYVAWMQQSEKNRNVGIPAPASVPEFLVGVVGAKAGMKLTAAPYRGSGPMVADMLGNQIPAGIATITDFIEHHKAGKMRIIATYGTQRQAQLPDVPTYAELGIAGMEDLPYFGVFAPAGTPRAAMDKFSEAMKRVLADAAVRERLTTLGLTVQHMTGDELGKRERAYANAWGKVIRESGFQPQ
jgi:tripartite-type tricarboxylate transporter receptor subunit TctC